MKQPWRPALLCAAAAALSTQARGAEANLSSFKPASGADGIIATEGARPWESAAPFDVKLWLDFAQRPVARPGGGALLENRTGGWFAADLHLIEPLSLAIAVPYTIHERGTLLLNPGPGQPIANGQGLGDIRITPRLGILRQERAGVDLAVQATVEIPSSDPHLLTTWGEPVAEGLISIGRKIGPLHGQGLRLLLNLYGFTAPNRQMLGRNLGPGFGARAGAAYETGRHDAPPSRVFAEIEAKSMPRTSIDEGPTPAEWRGGLSWCFGPGFTADLAAGRGLDDAPGAPSYRVIGALGFGANACSRRAAASGGKAGAAADQAAADKVAAEHAAAARAAADRAAAQRAAAEKAAAEKEAAQRAAAQRAAADRAAAEAVEAATKDRDGDGIPDVEDNCPTEPGPRSNRGCREIKKQLVALTPKGIELAEQVRFSKGRASIAPASYKLLDQVAQVILSHPELRLEVQGHTDDSGDPRRNEALSQARADAVARYLVEMGVDASRLVAKGYGATAPVGDDATPEGREQNRRVEFRFVK